jgi:lipoprotein-anchoring transpeptidase ErfK/SrfK
MRKLFAALAFVLAIAVAVPAPAGATATAEQQLVLKKKKLAVMKAEARKKAAAAERKAEERKRLVHRDCGSFLQCLLGKQRGAVASRLRVSAAGGSATAEIVAWKGAGKYAQGSIIVRTPERALYYVLGDGKARRYKVGVGREGFQWSGSSRIVAKQEWPAWRPPEEMIRREAEKGHLLPEMMEGGPENPLGARALYIGGTIYRIHGTNNVASIGGAVSSGCIRMMNSDVIDLYRLVRVGAKVYVYQ